MSTRGARKREDNLDSDEGRRPSKRIKPSPESPVSPPASNMLPTLVADLLEDIKEIPPDLVIQGFARGLKRLLEEEYLADPTTCDLVLGAIDEALTKAEEVKLPPFLIKSMIRSLDGKLKHISMIINERLTIAMQSSRICFLLLIKLPEQPGNRLLCQYLLLSRNHRSGPRLKRALMQYYAFDRAKGGASLVSPCMTLFAASLMGRNSRFLRQKGLPRRQRSSCATQWQNTMKTRQAGGMRSTKRCIPLFPMIIGRSSLHWEGYQVCLVGLTEHSTDNTTEAPQRTLYCAKREPK
jgi:hypothetical protein